MKYNELGKTGLVVSQIAYGALPVGPTQANFPVDKGAAIIRYALEQGINFIDTAQSYKTYNYIRQALQGWDKPVVINSKCAGASYEEMQAALQEAERELGRMPDIFTLHAARAGTDVFQVRAGALKCLVDAKKAGIIKAVGFSTHSAEVMRIAAQIPEIDVIHPLLNIKGLGIQDGGRDEMQAGVELAAANGKGIYLMKVMAGGHLGKNYQEAIAYALSLKGVNSMAIGMLSNSEIEANIAALEGKDVSAATHAELGKIRKKLLVQTVSCIGCGACENTCPNFAIKVAADSKKAVVDPEKCILCGYCVLKCPRFSLRVITDATSI